MRRDIGTDDPRVRVRPSKGSRPRTKIRPDYSGAPVAEVVGIDRGRYRLLLPAESGGARPSEARGGPTGREGGRTRGGASPGIELTAVKARELGRGTVAVGDRVRVTGDISGRKDTLARLVRIEERTSELRRSPEDGEGRERVIVANADQLAIVASLARPEPRPGMIDRCLVAAYDAGMVPILVLTKADLADPGDLLAAYAPLGVAAYVTGHGGGGCTTAGEPPAGGEGGAPDAGRSGRSAPPAVARLAPPSVAQPEGVAYGLEAVRGALAGHETVLVGHSGVGKSTLINALIPTAGRATGRVNGVTGKGRHTSTSAVSLALPEGGRIVDTPGVRGFGLAHVSPDDVLRGFVDLAGLAEACPRGCTHAQAEPDCALGQAADPNTIARVVSFRRLLAARTDDWS